MQTSAILSITQAEQQLNFSFKRNELGFPLPIVGSHRLTDEERAEIHERLSRVLAHLYYFYEKGNSQDKKDPLQNLGTWLYTQLLPQPIRDELDRLIEWGRLPLLISTNETSIPWELLYSPNQNVYLGIEPGVGREILSPGPQPRMGSSSPNWQALLIGNPSDDLSYSSLEVEQISDLVFSYAPDPDITILSRDQASIRQVRDELASGRYRLIHYSGHAVFDPSNPEMNGLVLRDGVLSTQEIVDCLQGTPWVFLNACWSGQEIDYATLNDTSVTGLASAFILGGAEVVIGTSWAVPDQGAMRFAKAIYADLLNGSSASQALCKIRRQFLQERPHDSIWAAYRVYGDFHAHLTDINRWQRYLASVCHFRLHADQSSLQIARQIRQLHTRMHHIVRRFGGEIVYDDYVGLTALFGLQPRENNGDIPWAENHAERALRASLEVLKTIRSAINMVTATNGDSISASIGIASDFVIHSSNDDFLLGQPFLSASWLSSEAKKEQILAADTVLRNTRNAYDAAPWQRLIVGNTPEDWENRTIYEILGRKESSPKPGTDVERSQIIEQLHDLWESVQRGNGKIVKVYGDGGIGKTHVIQNFCSKLTLQPVQPIVIQCQTYENQVGYAAIASLFRQLLELEEKVTIAQVRTFLGTYFTSINLSPERVEQQINMVCLTLGLEIDETQMPLPSDPKHRHSLLAGTIDRILNVIVQKVEKLCLILDDFHCIDELSLAVLTRLQKRIEKLPVLLLISYRTRLDPVLEWANYAHVFSIHIKKLARHECITLIEKSIGGSILPSHAEEIAEWSSFNPFFVLETLRTLRLKDILRDEAGSWVLTGPLEASKIPQSIQGTVLARLDVLHESTRHIVHQMAILGIKVDKKFLTEMVYNCDTNILDEELHQLELHDFVEIEDDLDGIKIQFVHALVRQAIYDSIPPEQKRSYHRQAAQSWRKLFTQKDEYLQVLAHHQYQSILSENNHVLSLDKIQQPTWLEEVASTLAKLGDLAKKNFANQNAIEAYQQLNRVISQLPKESERKWVRCFEGLGDVYQRIGDLDNAIEKLRYSFGLLRSERMTPSERRQAAHLARKLARIYMVVPNWDEAIGWMEEGLDILNALSEEVIMMLDHDDQAVVAWLQIHKGAVYFYQGDLAKTQFNCELGLQKAERVGDQLASAEGYNLLGAVLGRQGQSKQAVQQLQHSLELFGKLKDRFQQMRVQSNLGNAFVNLGQWDQALQMYEEPLAFWREEVEDWYKAAIDLLNVGAIYHHRGDWDSAEEHYLHGQALCRRMGDIRMLALSYTNLGMLYVTQGQIEKGQEALNESLLLLEKNKIQDSQAEVFCGLAEIAIANENNSEAIDLTNRALRIATAGELEHERCIALRLQGIAFLHSGNLSQARTTLEKSLKIARDNNLVFEVGRTLLQLGEQFTQVNQPEEGLEYIWEALEIFEEIRSQLYTDRAKEIKARLLTLTAN
ncbi:MAG: CHAT domain-containing protein [Chloroflexota bacterium]